MSAATPPIEERTLWRVALARLRRQARTPLEPRHGRVLGIGLIGAGNVARWQHLPALQRHPQLFRLAAVHDVETPRARELATRHTATLCPTAQGVIDHPLVDAVLVCTPTAFHRDAVLAAVQAGKPVLCEKPLASTVEDAHLLWSTARTARVRALVNFSFRFRADFALVRRLIREGVLGQIHHVWGSLSQGQWFTATGEPSRERGDAAPWKFGRDGGVVLDLGPHVIDLMRWWLGEIDRVQAWTKSAPLLEENDAACGLGLTFASGATAHVLTSRLATGSKEQGHLEITGTQGALRFEQGTVHLWTRAIPRWRRLLVPPLRTDLLTTFYDAIQDPSLTAPDFWDGYKNNEALAAVMESARSGTMVKLPLGANSDAGREPDRRGTSAPTAATPPPIETVLVRT